MLNSFSLSNFKAFGSEQNIPLRPITLVFGANSAGKSSVLHSLLLARHALDTGEWDVNHPRIAGDSVDLGGFSNYLHKKEMNPVGAMSFSLAKTLDQKSHKLSRLLSYAKEIRLTLNIAAIGGAKASLRDCCVEVDNERLFLLAPKSDGKLGINVWEASHALSEKMLAPSVQESSLPGDVAQYRTIALEEMIALQQSANLDASGFLPTNIRFGDSARDLSDADPLGRLRLHVRRLFSETVRDILADLYRLFANDLRSLEYLGPLRSYPSRHLLDNETTDPNWHSGGGFAWQVVQDNNEVRTKVNSWLASSSLKTPYRLEVDRLIHETAIRQSLPELLRKRILGFAEAQASREWERKESLFKETQLYELLSDNEAIANFLQSQPVLLDGIAQCKLDMLKGDHLLASQEPDYHRDYDLAKAREETLEDVRFGTFPQWEYDEIIRCFVQSDENFRVAIDELIGGGADSLSFIPGLMKSDTSLRSELRLIDQRTSTAVTHRDVGIGISQVLPVLVLAHASKNKLIAIEQPEIHLHPALQAELGDLFVESSLGENGNCFILETHSEHLILRLLRRVRETTEDELEAGKRPLRPSDLCVLFVEPTEGGGSRVLELPVTPDGDFGVPWPGGFFAERTREMF